mgnify:CR=1 FL=1
MVNLVCRLLSKFPNPYFPAQPSCVIFAPLPHAALQLMRLARSVKMFSSGRPDVQSLAINAAEEMILYCCCSGVSWSDSRFCQFCSTVLACKIVESCSCFAQQEKKNQKNPLSSQPMTS